MGRRGCGFAVVTVAAVALGGPMRAAAEEACGASGPEVEVAAVLDDLDLVLADGRVLRLAGIDPARSTLDHPSLGQEARAALEHWVGGRGVKVAALVPTPDRWDRVDALVGFPDGSAPSGSVPVGGTPDGGPSQRGLGPAPTLNEALIASGWARFRPGSPTDVCRPTFLDAEARARAAGRGLWADNYYAPISAGDPEALARRTGAIAIVEGKAALRRERFRTIVSLSGRGRRELVAVVLRRDEKRLAKSGLDLQKLVGRDVRIRGFLDDRFGPRIDLVGADQVEFVGPTAENRASASGWEDPGQNH